jgi:hypothetical protein
MIHGTWWKVIILGVLWLARNEISAVSPWMWWFAICVVITAGFLDLGTVGGQAWIDRYGGIVPAMLKGPGKKPGDDGSPPGGEPPQE